MALRDIITANLLSALELIKCNSSYESQITQISEFNENILRQLEYQTPLVMLLDPGIEELKVWEETAFRYKWKIGLYGVVQTETKENLNSELNKLVSSLKQFIYSQPSLGNSVLQFKYMETSETRFYKDHTMADVLINCEIIYYSENGAF